MLNFSDCRGCESVFAFFEQISAIPHGSHNTSAIADYLCDFAKKRGLWYVKDAHNNVVIKKPATKGCETRPTVIIQGHTDMVAEKIPTLDIDMTVCGLKLYRDEDFLRAEGTTLGGDDGVAVAYALALLDATDIPHPAIEAVFTSDEEVGLLGAAALDTSVLDGKIMINIDSDEEGIFTVGCAGGARADISLNVDEAPCSAKTYKLSVSGLIGGHSGVEIGKNRSNAIKLCAQVLSQLTDVRLATLFGGNMDNAIPRECTAYFACNSDIRDKLDEIRSEIISRIAEYEPSIKIECTPIDCTEAILDKASTERVLSLINSISTGVIAMSADIEGLVESSQNIGIVRLGEGKMALTVSVRSSKANSKRELIAALADAAKKHSASFSTRGEYPAWEYKKVSHLRDVACKVYRDMYGKDAEVIAIHAGLECGIFSDKMPELDCISIGPDNYSIHTTEEHLSISSTVRVWEFLLNVLKEI